MLKGSGFIGLAAVIVSVGAILASSSGLSVSQLVMFVAPSPLTKEEISACAVMAAVKWYKRDARSEQDAVDSLIVDNGTHPDYEAISDSYKHSTGLDTIFTSFVSDGKDICRELKARGQSIIFPPLKISEGCRIVGGTSSRAMVCGNDPEPVFGCMDGYHSVTGKQGDECVKD